jgi:hypothetical protein
MPGSSVPVGYHLTATAILTSGGSSNDISQSAQWSVSPAGYASVEAGQVSCLQTGNIIVTATASSTTGSTNLTCSPSTFNSPTQFIEQSKEFLGPFSSWTNLKTVYGAKGDGITDDTQAIQTALNQLSSIHVLYIPAGNYRITQPLTVLQQQSFAIIGEDPGTTKIVWDGTPDQAMLDIDGSSTFRVSRLTFDGSSKALAAEEISDHSNGLYTTKVEISDEHLMNAGYGIYLVNSAETTIERVFFDHEWWSGVQLTNFNDINIFVTDSLFSYCQEGVSNYPGAGSFYVSNSYFDHSVAADMEIANTGNFGARHNTSVDSGGNFFLAGTIGANNAEITIQGNTVIDPTGSAVSLGDTGPLMLIDNIFRTKGMNAPVVWGYDNSRTTPGAAFSFGNIYTSAQPLTFAASWGQVWSYDDSTVDPSSIPTPSIPTGVYVPESADRKVFEVVGNDQAAIQAAINAAAASGTPKPIVHVPLGNYLISHTINFPQGSDIQLVGDEVNGSALTWNGSGSSGPVIAVPSSAATISNLTINSGQGQLAGDGLLLQIPDQPTNIIVGDQLLLQGNDAVSMFSDMMEHVTEDFSSLYTWGSESAISVSGGQFRTAGQATLGRVDYLSGSTQASGQGVSMTITHHGRLLVQDNWHDGGATGPNNFVLTDSGTLTEQDGGVFTQSTPFVLNNFDGDVTLLGLQFTGGFQVSATSNKANLLTLGDAAEGNPIGLPAGSDLVTVANIADGSYYSGYGGYQQAQSSTADVPWLRHMLGQVRSETAVPLSGSNQSAVHLDRIQIENMQNALHVVPEAPLPGHYLTVQSALGGILSYGGSCASAGSSDADDPASQWVLQYGGEGDFLLVPNQNGQISEAAGLVEDSDGNWMLAVEPLTDDYKQHWNIQLGPDGYFRLINRGTGLALTPGSPISSCATGTEQQAAAIAEWTIAAH